MSARSEKKKKGAFVNDLAAGAPVEAVFRIAEAALKTTRKGDFYIDAVLSDRTGAVAGKLWDASKNAIETWQPGKFIAVRGDAETYQGKLQLVVRNYETVASSEVELADFDETSPITVEELEKEFKRLRVLVTDEVYAALLESVFSDAGIWERFRDWPAAVQYHHAYRHGLLEHTVAVAGLALEVVRKSGRLNEQLLLTGALLHDVGKVYELSGAQPYKYTDEGGLCGHLYLGARMVETKATGSDEQKVRLLVHLILSHHGAREFGSPVLPAVPEAFALHHLDNIDAKVQAACYAIAGDPNATVSWTEYLKMLGTRLYKADLPNGGHKPET